MQVPARWYRAPACVHPVPISAPTKVPAGIECASTRFRFDHGDRFGLKTEPFGSRRQPKTEWTCRGVTGPADKGCLEQARSGEPRGYAEKAGSGRGARRAKGCGVILIESAWRLE